MHSPLIKQIYRSKLVSFLFNIGDLLQKTYNKVWIQLERKLKVEIANLLDKTMYLTYKMECRKNIFKYIFNT